MSATLEWIATTTTLCTPTNILSAFTRNLSSYMLTDRMRAKMFPPGKGKNPMCNLSFLALYISFSKVTVTLIQH